MVVGQPENGAKVMYGNKFDIYDQEVSPTFTDVGLYKVYYEVSADGYISCRGESTVEISEAKQTPPPAPTVNSVTFDSVTLNSIENGEYKYLYQRYYYDGGLGQYVWGWEDGCFWQDSPVFTGLTENTTYRFVQRFKGSPNYYDSSASDYMEVTTGIQGYNVVFNLNGHGKQVPRSLYIEEDGVAARPADPVDEDGWTFGGWYTDKACTSAYDFTTPVGANITLYAKWVDGSVVTYTVTFNANGVEASGMPATQTVEEGGIIVKPDSDPLAEGYTFGGWYTDEACTAAYDFTTPVTAETTLYAKWVEDAVVTYTVSFNANEVTASGMPAIQTVEEGKIATKPASDPSAEGYKFEGWYKEAAGTNEFDFTKAITEDTVVYAKGTKTEAPEPAPDPEPVPDPEPAPMPVPGKSVLDPVPEIKDGTTKLYLVKGQKFTLDSSWSLDGNDKDKLKAYKKLLVISKKGKVTAKKPGDVVIVKKDASGNVIQSIAVNITKPELANKKLKLEAGVADKDTGSIALKNAENIDVYYYSAAPDVAIVDQSGKVTAVAKGSARITAYANGSAYTATVSVKEPSAVKKRTLHLSVNGSKSVRLRGVKKTAWDYAEGATEEEKAVVSITNAKITANKAGTVTLIAKDEMTSYKMTVRVDDPSITPVHIEDKYDLKASGKNKYALTIAEGQKLTLSYADIDRPVVYKSSKPEIAFIDVNGNIEARSRGTGKFTGKINGKTITINVTVK